MIGSTLPWLIVLLAFIPIIFMFIWLSLWPKTDIIETHETTVQIVAAVMSLLLLLILFAIAGIVLLFYVLTLPGWLGLIASPLAGTLIFPLPFAIISYVRLPKILKSVYETEPAMDAHLEEQATYHAQILGIKRLPRLQFFSLSKALRFSCCIWTLGRPPHACCPKRFYRCSKHCDRR
jgi:hypothetical protein